MNNTNIGRKASVNNITPKLSLFNPNAKGTGSAIQFELRPAHGIENGAIFVRIANQRNNQDGTIGFAWDEAAVFKLEFHEICKLMQVWRGECESLNDGRGFTYFTQKYVTGVFMRHVVDPVSGYIIDVTRTPRGVGADEKRDYRFFIHPSEALGLCFAFEGAMKEIAFGTGFEHTTILMARDAELAYGGEPESEVPDTHSTTESDTPSNGSEGVSEAGHADEEVEEVPEDFGSIKVERKPEGSVRRPTDREFSAATRRLLAVYGQRYSMEIDQGLSTVYAARPVTDNELRYGIKALGYGDPVMKYALSLGVRRD